ncbi:MAG: M1 family metallopeptidase [Candidatus Coproplasma sp.]
MKKLFAYILTAAMSLSLIPLAACTNDQRDISRYEISVCYDQEESKLSGTVEFTYYNNTQNEIYDLKFNLWGNAYRQDALYRPVSEAYSAKAYYSGESYGGMEIENVENCAGWNVGGEDQNILTVNLLTPVYPDDNASVTITYSLTLSNVEHRTGVTENTVNLGNFYPVLCAYTTEGFAEHPYISCGEPFVSDCADYEVTLTVPYIYKAAASGALCEESRAGDNAIYRYSLSNSRDFAMVLSDKFEVLSRTEGGVQINYYYYSDTNPQTSLTVAAESLSYFSDTFGEYAYPTLSVVQTGFCQGGMEYPGLTMISDACDAATALYTIVHENAHQWWYAAVGNDQFNSGWQDEGLAEYSSLMFFENTPEYGLTRTGMLGSATKAYRAFYSVYNQIFGDADTTMNRPVSAYLSDYEYVNIAYNKALLLFEAVRTACGDAAFISALKEYYSTYKFCRAEPEALIAVFAGRADVEGIFESFIQGKIII